MRNKTKRVWFLLLVTVLLLAPGPVAYAYTQDDTVGGGVRIEAAEPAAAPSWTVFEGMVGGVGTAGTLFYIDVNIDVSDINKETDDVQATLYLTNTRELARCYRYLTLEVGVYVQSGPDQWQRVLGENGQPVPDNCISILNSALQFNLKGNARYKVTIDGGCFYCTRADDGGSVSPTFKLAVN